MRVTLIAVVVALGATACSPGDADTTSSTSSDAVVTTTTVAPTTSAPFDPSGGVVRIGVLELPSTHNPIAEEESVETSALIRRATLPGAFDYDAETWQTVPDLVVRIPTRESGDVTLERGRQSVTWTIDPAATWSDGTPVTGGDFAFTLEAELGLTECGGHADLARVIGVEIVDVGERTITVEMPGPTTTYESLFDVVVPAHATDGSRVCTDDGLGWPSAGPFVAAALTDDSFLIRRNEAYWRGPPAIAGVEFVLYESEPALASAFAAGDIDLVVTESADLATQISAAGADVSSLAGGRLEQLTFNFAIGGPTEDSLVRSRSFRRAIARALDRGALADAAGGVAVDGVLRSVDPSEPWSAYAHDSGEARRLMTETCTELGRDCESEPPVLRLIASNFGGRAGLVDLVVENLAAIGVVVEADVLSSREFFDAVDLPGWDMAILALGERAGVSAAAESLLATLDPEAVGNVSGYGGGGSIVATERAPFRLELFAGQIEASPDLDRVRRLLGEVHALLASEVVFVPIMARPRYTLIDADQLSGVVANASPSGVAWNAEDWVLADA